MLSFSRWSAILLMVVQITAQVTNDPVSSFLSEAFSVYTEVTSILGSDASHAASSTSNTTPSTSPSSTASSSASSFSSSSSSTSASPSSSSTQASSTSNASTTKSITSGTAAATSASNSSSAVPAHSGRGLSSTNLAIILGCVLGALALGLLILALLLCCRRRRRSRTSSPTLLSATDREIESWRHHEKRPQSRDALIGGLSRYNHHPNHEEGIVPVVDEHSSHQNPFVPVPPAPRRSIQNLRPGATNGTLIHPDSAINSPENLQKDHHHGSELAAGAGGVALGAAALHRHDKNKRRENDYQDRKNSFTRKPVPVATPVSNSGVYPTTTTNDDAYALNKVPSRKSGEAPRYSGDGYGYGYGTGPYEAAQRAHSINSNNHHGYGRHSLLAAGAGALGGAALANHQNRNHSRSRSRSNSAHRRSYDSAKNPGPNALVDHARNPMPVIQPMNHHSTPLSSNELVSPISSDSYTSATGAQNGHNITRPAPVIAAAAIDKTHHTPSEMPADVPMPTTSPRNSFHSTHSTGRPRSLSGGAPAAAALAYPNHRRHQSGGDIHNNNNSPRLPSRSPRRARFSDSDDPVPPPTSFPNTAVHHPLGLGGQGHDSSATPDTSSSDSTWRLSSGMPGGWGRNSNNGGGHNRRQNPNLMIGPNSDRPQRDSSPAANSAHLANAGINPFGRMEGNRNASPVRHSVPSVTQPRRLRLADLRREEEEKEEEERRRRLQQHEEEEQRLAARQSMGSEWTGGGAYDGYERGDYSGGVGQAM